MTPEQRARQNIDRLLEAAGWAVQDYSQIHLGAALGVAVREFPLKSGYADYLLFVGRRAVGVIEAKPEGVTLGAVAEQSARYVAGLPAGIPHAGLPLPFAYESTGVETFFRDERDPDARSRRVFAFHRPETLQEWAQEPATLRARLRALPPLVTVGLRACQVEAVQGLERSLADNRPRSLLQMATGSGKTFTAVTQVYRLIKHAGARRVLFLVDRANLGRQTEKEFQQYRTPDDGRTFTELYNVQRLTSNAIDPVARVTISTIQRVFSMLKGTELEEDSEEQSLYESAPLLARPVEVTYNPKVPIETYDFIVIDECHRSIYNLWRQVLEYFDAFLIGLTATPSKQTLGFFNQNLVLEYPHERAVADGVNVGFDVYRIKTRITEGGSTVEAGYQVGKLDKRTRKQRYQTLDEELEYQAAQLDRSVVSPSQIRTVIRTFREKLFTELFPGRTTVPKTLIFAKDDNHAEEILHIVREEFGKGNDFCKKITYRVTGEKPENLIAEFRNSPMPRIAVTVDMIATGTDIKPLECLVFMRDVKSSVYFEQMKGRGTRVIDPTDLQAVTPDTREKTHFVIVDAVGVTEGDRVTSQPLERKRSVSLKKLLDGVKVGMRDEDTLATLAGRLARLEQALDPKALAAIEEVAGGEGLKSLANRLLDAVDPDRQLVRARAESGADTPAQEEIQRAAEALAQEACAPFELPKLREAILAAQQEHELTIDHVSLDEVLQAGYDGQQGRRAEQAVQSFRAFIEAHKDEITALQIFYSQPYGRRHFTLKQIRELAEAIQKPPLRLSPDALWKAYEQLERDRVKGAGEQRLLTDIIALVRHARGEDEELVPFRMVVDERFYEWLGAQDRVGRRFTPEQLEWLEMIKGHLATSLTVEVEDFENPPFHARGGPLRAVQLFGRDQLRSILEELNEVVVA